MRADCRPNPAAERAAQDAHRQILRLQAGYAALVAVRGAALAELKGSGYTNADLGRLLGVTRVRAFQLVADHAARKKAAAEVAPELRDVTVGSLSPHVSSGAAILPEGRDSAEQGGTMAWVDLDRTEGEREQDRRGYELYLAHQARLAQEGGDATSGETQDAEAQGDGQ